MHTQRYGFWGYLILIIGLAVDLPLYFQTPVIT